MKIEEMGMILGKAAVVFPNHKITPEFVKAWYSYFENLPAEKLEPALRAAIMEPGRSFFPAIGDVNKYIQAAKPQLPDAGEVWDKLCRLAGGRDQNPWEYLQNNPAGQKALRHIGWDTIRLADLETELPFRKREFMQIYNQALDSHAIKERAVDAIGTTEAKHVLNGITRQLLEAKQ